MGILVDVEDPAPGVDVYVLDADGSRVELGDDALNVHGLMSIGALVLTGSLGEQEWYVAIPDSNPDDGGCFTLRNGSAIDEGSSILFPLDTMYGLRLDKAADWTPPIFEPSGDRYPSWVEHWCVNDDGQVQRGEE